MKTPSWAVSADTILTLRASDSDFATDPKESFCSQSVSHHLRLSISLLLWKKIENAGGPCLGWGTVRYRRTSILNWRQQQYPVCVSCWLLLYKVFLFICVGALPCVPGACAGLERALGALELQLETITSHHMGAGKKTISLKSSQRNGWAISPAPPDGFYVIHMHGGWH